MSSIECAFSFSVASVVEDVLQQYGNRSRELDLDARRAEETAMRRYEAAAWLRKVVGVVGAKDLPAEPSEEEFRFGLRSGLVLCNALNKIQPGAVHKVVESPCDASLIPDGAALSAYQYFENVRNFLVAVQEMGMPTFEASDLEQGGKSSRIVNCVLALKSYSEWKQTGGNGVWKFGGNVKTTMPGKQFVRKHSEPFTSSLARNMPTNEKSSDGPVSSLSMLVRAILLDKKPDEVPNLVESVLSKVVEEFEHRIASQIELKKANPGHSNISYGNKLVFKPSSSNIEEQNVAILKKENINNIHDIESESRGRRQQMLVDQQQIDIKVLKQNLSTTKAGMQFMQMKFHEEIQNLGLHIHGLAHAASGYHKVLEDNRKLYNQVQDLKGSIRVYCRVRPFLPGQFNSLSSVDHIEEGIITINTLVKNGKGRKSFNFNKVFGPSATQEEVFSDTEPLIRSVLDGYNVCIFAYGQTGSGKTYTMTGPKDLREHDRGVNYRALSDLFLLAEQRKYTFSYDVYVQMIEIYNEQVRDLLTTDGLSKRLEIRNSSQTGLSVPDASLVRVSSTSDVIDLMNIGLRNRSVGATALNDRSSRSHSCLTVHVQGKDLTSGAILRGRMHLVDLAGSERVDKSEVTGDRLKEAQHINKSLSALGDVISSLALKNSHVPYRNSKLTQLLQDSLGGQAKTLMFVHISPEFDAIGETISTLKFAERVATVELGAARVNKDSGDVKELKEQIAYLKAALSRKEEMEPMQQKTFMPPSPVQPSVNARTISIRSPNGFRRQMEDLGSLETMKNSIPRQKRHSMDLDELLANTSLWPPVSSPYRNTCEDDREVGPGEWVDKIMVNRQDNINWEANDGNISDADYYQKILSDSYTGKSFDVFAAKSSFDVINGNDNLEETSNTSETDLLWQFNSSKIGSSNGNGIHSKVKYASDKQAKNPEIRTMVPKLGSSPLRKPANAPQRIGRQTTDIKRKTGSRK